MPHMWVGWGRVSMEQCFPYNQAQNFSSTKMRPWVSSFHLKPQNCLCFSLFCTCMQMLSYCMGFIKTAVPT